MIAAHFVEVQLSICLYGKVVDSLSLASKCLPFSQTCVSAHGYLSNRFTVTISRQESMNRCQDTANMTAKHNSETKYGILHSTPLSRSLQCQHRALRLQHTLCDVVTRIIIAKFTDFTVCTIWSVVSYAAYIIYAHIWPENAQTYPINSHETTMNIILRQTVGCRLWVCCERTTILTSID